MVVKRLLLAFALLLGFAQIAGAQGQAAVASNGLGGQINATSSACATAFSCVWMKVPSDSGTVSVSIAGTFSATIVIEDSNDGTTFATIATYTTAQTAVPLAISGMTDVRARATSYASGTAFVNLFASKAPNSSSGSLAAGTNAIGTVGITNTAGTTDPCANPSVLKSSAFLNITTATTTQIIAQSGSTVDYVCEFDANMTGTTAADTVILEIGTGSNCASNVTVISPTYSSGILTSGATNINVGNGGATVFTSVVGSREICVLSTVATSPTIGVHVTYVQQ